MKYSKEERAMWLEDWHASGKNAWAYAKENGIIPQTFCSWAKRAAEVKNEFVEIRPRVKPVKQTSTILIEKGDVKIHFPHGININELSAVIESLQVKV